VALTFDDGPDARSTLAVRDVLDRYGVKATFFTVGKALDARPGISRALLADGQLLANHSYHHDALDWLDPRYPEIERTQRAFRRRLGVCPTFFRPPHGQHTPFMAAVATAHHMTMVGWNVSSADWATRDPRLVASRTLQRVRPGSIILLHDGLDGNGRADRTVVVRALPLILNGLRARRLRPVRLDRLLGLRGYAGRC
jgi:peptidoglycan/xylan/chitin deacetylase (PgdA/CDA1 family)